jgi:elongation factor G
VGDSRKPFKASHIYLLQGKQTVEVPFAVPGDIVAVAKVDALHYDAVLHDAPEDDHIHMLPLELPKPVHGLAIQPMRHGDEQRLWEILAKLVDEDPCLKVEHVATSNETVVYGLGELHLRVLLERMRETYKFEVKTQPPRIAYRETITGKAEGHHRHKKQTGGAGQFGEVFLRVEPMAAGAGYEFVDAVKGGTVPREYIPAVDKGLQETLPNGVLAGFPVVDVKVTLFDGSYHDVDSNENAFKMAASMAFKDAMRKASPVLLEPMMAVEVETPEDYMGNVMGDLSGRRGIVHGMEDAPGGIKLVKAEVPLAEMFGYSTQLRSLSQGRATYSMEFKHYSEAPKNVAEAVINKK